MATDKEITATQPEIAVSSSSEKNSSDFDSIRNLKQAEGEAYASGGDTRYYEPIDSYEGKHRWDPKADWTDKEEKHVIRKLDMRICSWACLMFFALQLDRGNINQALSDNMLNDLGLNTNQYNYGQSIFYLCFLCAELPSQMISKKLGPDNWIPIQMVCWSIVAICQCRLTGESSFYACRALLGLIEGGFIPDVILYLSYFYKSKELPIRLSFFWASYITTQIVSAFLALGILKLRGYQGWEGWRWLFALEGILTALIGVASWFYLPPSPTQTASYFRGKNGWFSEREEVIMVNRILRDDPSKGDMHNRQGLSLKLLWKAVCDYDLWPIYLLGFTWTLPTHTITAYLTLILRSLGFNTFNTNLLTIPASVLCLIQLIFWTWFSERGVNSRFFIILICQIWMLPLIIALAVLPGDYSAWSRYALLVMCVGFPYVHAIIVAITSRNAGSVRTRTVGSALYNMAVQASSIISSNVYREEDKPLYRKGNRVLIGIVAWNFVLIVGTKAYYVWRNKSRDKIWNAMSDEEKRHYLATTTDEGNKRLDFRFAH
ncbi:major facilitator superfamily domain-containing protein [Immersiella caudata]|uniref:Major facilitator superfamily domain-containing protein n=1 Tax=Immersiella caudata TaxID=314043 RepID=A0AA40C0D9_9PEZI|nr:major facilitator superfamily domain-containing protein [Immersiella caudata]